MTANTATAVSISRMPLERIGGMGSTSLTGTRAYGKMPDDSESADRGSRGIA
jgi:hypothetical protein